MPTFVPGRKIIEPKTVLMALAIGLVFAVGSAAIVRSVAHENGWSGAETPGMAQQTLAADAQHDKKAVKKLLGRWVPQLMGDETSAVPVATLRPSFVLMAHERDSRRYGALLITSDDYNYTESGLYLSIVPKRYKTGKKALNWCRQHDLGPDRCVAKRLTHGSAKRSVLEA